MSNYWITYIIVGIVIATAVIASAFDDDKYSTAVSFVGGMLTFLLIIALWPIALGARLSREV